jgi:hypothetical protein
MAGTADSMEEVKEKQSIGQSQGYKLDIASLLSVVAVVFDPMDRLLDKLDLEQAREAAGRVPVN